MPFGDDFDGLSIRLCAYDIFVIIGIERLCLDGVVFLQDVGTAYIFDRELV